MRVQAATAIKTMGLVCVCGTGVCVCRPACMRAAYEAESDASPRVCVWIRVDLCGWAHSDMSQAAKPAT